MIIAFAVVLTLALIVGALALYHIGYANGYSDARSESQLRAADIAAGLWPDTTKRSR